MVFEKLKEILAEQLDVDADSITKDSLLIEDLGADSLDAIDIVMSVEDEFKIADVIASRLRNEQYIVDVYGDGEEGLDNALTNIYDLIILDVMLTGIEGFKILQEIRKQKIESKVIMLTAKSMLEDKLTGFDAGSNVQIKVVRGLGYKLEC